MQILPISESGKTIDSFLKMFSFDITPHLRLLKFRPGEHLFRQGEGEQKLYYVIRGRAKILINQPNGRTSLVAFLQAPAFVGELELLGSQQQSHSVVATGTLTAFAINTATCREQLLQDAGFLRELCLFLSRKTLQNSVSHSKNASYPLEVRLADFILKNEIRGSYSQPHTEVCQYLGVSYRHLLYVFADFVDRGLLKKEGRRYTVADREGLHAISAEMDE